MRKEKNIRIYVLSHLMATYNEGLLLLEKMRGHPEEFPEEKVEEYQGICDDLAEAVLERYSEIPKDELSIH